MRHWRVLLVGLAMAMAGASPVRADFDAGVKAYDAGDFTGAFKHWLREAKKGDAAAQRNVATLYRLGKGVEVDLVEARRWYQAAAEQGFGKAQVNLGAMMVAGQGGPEDAWGAASWFRKAADQNQPLGQFYLGQLYEAGSGVAKDPVKALGWYNLAARGGSLEALNKLSQMVAHQPFTLEDMNTPDRLPVEAATAFPAPLAAAPPASAPQAPAQTQAKGKDGDVFGFMTKLFKPSPPPVPVAAPATGEIAAPATASVALPAPAAAPVAPAAQGEWDFVRGLYDADKPERSSALGR